MTYDQEAAETDYITGDRYDDKIVQAYFDSLIPRTYNFSVFKPAYWNAKPSIGEPRWCYDTEIKAGIVTWDDLMELFIQNHEPIETKELAHMFTACQWKSKLDDGVVLKHTRYGREYVAKTASNVVAASMLILDYDDGTTIETVKERLHEWLHIGYTSHSHKPEHHKFRIIIPLKTPVPIHLMKKTKYSEQSILPALYDTFKGLDLTTFDLARSFFMPSCPAANQHFAQSWCNNGTEFDWTTLPITTTFRKQFVPIPGQERTDILHLFRNAGLYQSPLCGKKHAVTCPWADNHSSDRNGGAVVWEGEGFCCKHNSCRDKSFKELLSALGVDFIDKRMEQEQRNLDALQAKLKNLKSQNRGNQNG